jgi:hypothetical protein
MAVACVALAGQSGCAPKVAEEQVASPQEGDAAKQEMEQEMQKRQQEMQQQAPPSARR